MTPTCSPDRRSRPRRIRVASSLILTALVLTALVACSKRENNPVVQTTPPAAGPNEPKRIASADVVQVSALPVSFNAGGTGEATVRLNIQSGYHVNANPPTYRYLKATELEIAPATGLSVEKVTYPSALEKKFEFAEKPLAVYEGQVELKAKIKADKSAKLGEQSLAGTLRIQACDNQVCYPPGTVNVPITVNIQ
jgi:thiol:disulfide interchange protein